MRDNLGAFLIAMIIFLCGISLGITIGKVFTLKGVKKELNKAVYAPTPIIIGDSTYIIRYYKEYTVKTE